MFNLGGGEILIILLVALLVIGPKKLPQIARTLGRVIGEFKRVSSDVQNTVNREVSRLEQDAKATTESGGPKAVSVSQPAAADLPDAVVGPEPDAVSGPEATARPEPVSAPNLVAGPEPDAVAGPEPGKAAAPTGRTDDQA